MLQVVFCKKLLQLHEIILFIREVTEPMIMIQTALFTRDCNYRVVYVLTAFVQSIAHIY